MWIVKFRCDKGHAQQVQLPEETGEKGAKLFAALMGGGPKGSQLADLIPGATTPPPCPCAWSDTKARMVVGAVACGAPVSWEVEHAPQVVTRGTRIKGAKGENPKE